MNFSGSTVIVAPATGFPSDQTTATGIVKMTPIFLSDQLVRRVAMSTAETRLFFSRPRFFSAGQRASSFSSKTPSLFASYSAIAAWAASSGESDGGETGPIRPDPQPADATTHQTPRSRVVRHECAIGAQLSGLIPVPHTSAQVNVANGGHPPDGSAVAPGP